MKSISSLLFLLVVLWGGVSRGAEPELLPWELLEKGWIQLFDGQTLFGWEAVADAEWEAADGEIRTKGHKPGFLMTTTEWANFELELEFRAAEGTNSGIFLRSAREPQDPTSDCYELNIAPGDNPFPTGSLVARQRAEGRSPKGREDYGGNAEDNWHELKIIAWGGWITAELDGRRVVDFSDSKPVRLGRIGLQSNSGPVAFRNIRLRPIEMMPLLAGGDLSKFSTERAEESRFEVIDDGNYDLSQDVLRVLDGPGQIETTDDFENFVLQFKCKVNGDGLNSGVFFRTRREGRWDGYESQIHNEYKDGDPTRPKDFGTGGIYRRQPARRIVANDGEWFAKTIAVNGPHMAVWVNGYQMSDWTDDRPVHESARQGKRLKGGAIAIQGHDPTTDLSFRDIRVVELPEAE